MSDHYVICWKNDIKKNSLENIHHHHHHRRFEETYKFESISNFKIKLLHSPEEELTEGLTEGKTCNCGNYLHR